MEPTDLWHAFNQCDGGYIRLKTSSKTRAFSLERECFIIRVIHHLRQILKAKTAKTRRYGHSW